MTMTMEVIPTRSRIVRLLLLVGVLSGLASCVKQPESSIDQTSVHARLSEEDALKVVLSRHPELEIFQANPGLPPRKIMSDIGAYGDWMFVFSTWGSGVDGIQRAECYRVSTKGKVTLAGRFTGDRVHLTDRLDPATCRP